MNCRPATGEINTARSVVVDVRVGVTSMPRKVGVGDRTAGMLGDGVGLGMLGVGVGVGALDVGVGGWISGGVGVGGLGGCAMLIPPTNELMSITMMNTIDRLMRMRS